MELPKEFKGTIYFYQNVKYDYFVVRKYKDEGDPDMVLLGSKDIEVSFDVSHDAAVKQVIQNLKQEKKRVQAEAQKQLNLIDEQINNLLAITHQPDSAQQPDNQETA